jgi:hypothetical protein
MQHGVSDHHDGENILKRVKEHHLPKGKPPKEKQCQPTRQCAENKRLGKKDQLYTHIKTVILLCASTHILRPSI